MPWRGSPTFLGLAAVFHQMLAAVCDLQVRIELNLPQVAVEVREIARVSPQKDLRALTRIVAPAASMTR